MIQILRFLLTVILFITCYIPIMSVAFCPCSKEVSNAKPTNSVKQIPEKKDPLETIKALLKTIKEDVNNHSYNQMLEDAKAEHSIKYHKPNAPFFYSNDAYVIKDIIDLLIDDPDGFIDETKSQGILKVYRDNNYHEEIEELFDREPLYRRDIPQPKKFQKDYLGQTTTGPTNKVMLTLKIKGDEQNENTLEKRLAYLGNNILFIDAFPEKAPPPPLKPQNAAGSPEGTSSIVAKPASGEAEPEEGESEDATPEAADKLEP